MTQADFSLDLPVKEYSELRRGAMLTHRPTGHKVKITRKFNDGPKVMCDITDQVSGEVITMRIRFLQLSPDYVLDRIVQDEDNQPYLQEDFDEPTDHVGMASHTFSMSKAEEFAYKRSTASSRKAKGIDRMEDIRDIDLDENGEIIAVHFFGEPSLYAGKQWLYCIRTTEGFWDDEFYQVVSFEKREELILVLLRRKSDNYVESTLAEFVAGEAGEYGTLFKLFASEADDPLSDPNIRSELRQLRLR